MIDVYIIEDFIIKRHLHQLSHSMLIIPSEAEDLSASYKAINEYLSKGYAVVYSAEMSSSAQILRKMISSGILPDAEDHIQSSKLTIIDEKIITEQKIQLNATQLADLLFSTASDVRRKSGAKKVVVICNTSLLLERMDYEKQIEFEQAINSKLGETKNNKEQQVEVFCSYSSTNVQQLNLKHLIQMVNAHSGIVVEEGKEWKHRDWHSSVVIEIITKGIEKSMDSLTAQLILKTFKVVYRIDENKIISNPALFEDTLRKIIGNNAADAVLASIKEEARRRITL